MKKPRKQIKAGSWKRYAAKLLFQYRIAVNSKSSKRRACEERIIILSARSDQDAKRRAKESGYAAEFHFLNIDDKHVFFEFIGILDMIHLGVECGPDEVWYDLKEMVSPKERRSTIIPPENKLMDSRPYKQRGIYLVRALMPAFLLRNKPSKSRVRS
jgi:hypothetical protein